METRSKFGVPVSPADDIMRTEEGADTRGWFAERHRHAHRDPPGYRPKVARGAAAVVAAVVAALWLAGCGGEVSAKVDPTADPKVEVKWERQVKAVCDLPVAARVEAMNQVNNALLNEAFVLFACPGTDPLNTDAKPILYNGRPALAVQVQVIYLLPGKGEQVNGGVESDARAVGATPRRPHQPMAPAQSAAGRTPLVRVGATFP